MRLIVKVATAFYIGSAAVGAVEHHWFAFMTTQASGNQVIVEAQLAPIPGLDNTSAIDSQTLRPLGTPNVTSLDMRPAMQAAAESRTRQLDNHLSQYSPTASPMPPPRR